MPGGSKSRRRSAALAALLQQPTLELAAAQAGIHAATLQRWLRQADFLADYRAARRQVTEAAVGHLQQLTAEAAVVLRRNMGCGHAGTEVRAAVAVLEQAAKGIDVFDLADKVAALEAQLQEVMARGSFSTAASGPTNGHARTPGPDRGGPGAGGT
jgi:hypothetical protein